MRLTTASEDMLKEPVYVFDIHDIVDLILASLQCIFEEGYIIRKCFYCGDLFVIHRANQKYCPTSVYTTAPKNCYQLAKEQRQLEKEKSGSAQMDKSIRTMYATKFGTHSDEYNNYIEESSKWKKKVRAKKSTEEEFAAWLKTHYKRKYREKNTAAET